MPRSLCVEYPQPIYHVMSRKVGQQGIFRTDVDGLGFLQPQAERCETTSFQLHAGCARRNPFHWGPKPQREIAGWKHAHPDR